MYQAPTNSSSPQAFLHQLSPSVQASPTPSTISDANLVSPQTHPDEAWFMDSGATHHMTPDITHLQQSSPYYGSEQVVVGNGKSIPVLNIGSSSISSVSSQSPIHLHSVLHTPHLSYNLISVAKLCHDNHAFVEFHSRHFFVKDLLSKTILLKGHLEDALYKLTVCPSTAHVKPPPSHPAVFLSTLQDVSLWHHRLGHPSFQIVRKVLSH